MPSRSYTSPYPPFPGLGAIADAGTPVYVYDLERLASQIAAVRSAFQGQQVELLFATMANPAEPILATVARLGAGACTNSIAHTEAALAAGVAPNRIQFSSTGVTENDFEQLAAWRVAVNLDSASQAELWFDRMAQPSAGVRVNAAAVSSSATVGDRIGVEPESVLEIASLARRHGAAVSGLHVYVGTNFETPGQMLPTIEGVFALAAKLPELDYINIGGGAGVDYTGRGVAFDLGEYAAGITRASDRLVAARGGRQVRVLFEPGRLLAAGCGVFLTRVTDIKQLNGQVFVAVDGSVASFPRRLFHPDSQHPATLLGDDGEERDRSIVHVVGRTTFSRDILAVCDLPSDIAPGDVIAIWEAGAYCQSMRSDFLGQPSPRAVFLGAE